MLWFQEEPHEPRSLKVKETVICEFEMYSKKSVNAMMTKFVLGTDHKKTYRGAGRAKYKKKIFAQGKTKRKKNHARQLTLKNIHAMA